ncbi:hypothetical protein BpHYR1_029234 [Brachionus plicatilis]|uniref:Uncharacterized protein n=1 Tax=Brachionus plicatilis TaxID=10195 RepID=A0A3M7S426_BRAPC|nr:hypothetical protein BpHYR1_029234 [Brachionus plicatilis]
MDPKVAQDHAKTVRSRLNIIRGGIKKEKSLLAEKITAFLVLPLSTIDTINKQIIKSSRSS